ncbi:MAG: LysM peptidoglycan-binding domain-containing M23 family metallopeptidase [Spirochaetes bacterium]|nr:LysM peptidoglycan-binding domain-containing M23 family metallopeptidase [Spirochaetota bacterium]
MFSRSAICAIIFIPSIVLALPRKENSSLHLRKIHTQPNKTIPTSAQPIVNQFDVDDVKYKSLSISQIKYPTVHRKKKISALTPKNSFRQYGMKQKKYIVRKGDTLHSIARKFNIDIHQLADYNQLSSHCELRMGQKLKIPVQKNMRSKSNSKNYENEEITLPPIRFIWPVRQLRVVHLDEVSGTRPLGVIIESFKGEPVFCAAHGTVEKIGEMRGFGRYVIMKHNHQYLTVYSGLKEIFVEEGDDIPRGRKLGTHEGSLHFQINFAGKPLNPLELLPEKKQIYSRVAH